MPFLPPLYSQLIDNNLDPFGKNREVDLLLRHFIRPKCKTNIFFIQDQAYQ